LLLFSCSDPGSSGNGVVTGAQTDAQDQSDACTPGADAAPDSGVASVQPSSVSDLLLWLEADEGITEAGGYVSEWADQSAQGNDASQPDPASQPQAVPAAINGLPAVRFDGTASFLNLPAGFSDFTKGLSAFIVVRPMQSSPPHAARFFDFAPSYGSLSDSILFVRYGSYDDQLFYQTYSAGTPGPEVTVSSGVTNDTWQRLGVVAQGGSALSETKATLYRDGAPIVTGAVYVPSLSTRGSCLLGRSNYASDSLLHADVAEVILFARAVTEPERQGIDAYLSSKWGL
jgi:hypothetical protein